MGTSFSTCTPDSAGTGGVSGQFRVFADDDDIWFTMNADWNGSQWAKDSPGQSGGFRFGRSAFEILYDNAGATTFTDWANHWRLPMGVTVNSAFETHGTIREIGKVALQATNTYSDTRTMAMGVPVTFRNRFPAIPSSVTFTPNDVSPNWSGTPVIADTSRDGFAVYCYQFPTAQSIVWWYGTYTAIA